ncbi:MAG: hypothetical protein Q8N99_03680 [Nanoarchaeota archaeon]|nr:hypothetical protein [Nanoarchaeota archaeon]
MKNISYKRDIVLIFFLMILVLTIMPKYVISQMTSNSSMIVGANILGFGEGSNEGVSIEIPDYVFLGNVTKEDPYSDEKKISINNTGTVPITVTPVLKDEDEIFKNLFFRTRMGSSNLSMNIFYRIGDYNLYIDKPATGKRARSEYCYMSLNMSGFDGTIREDLIDYRTELVFIAMEY